MSEQCEHKEWTQVQYTSDTPWRCSCGMTMPAWGMVLWVQIAKLQERVAADQIIKETK